jgi:hypothetical protein
MRFNAFSFGSIRIDGTTYEHDVVIDRGQVRKRKKKPSKKFRDAFGHTPLSIEEEIPWKCRRLVGAGVIPHFIPYGGHCESHISCLRASSGRAQRNARMSHR